jgi:two-component SAPR family response regulator
MDLSFAKKIIELDDTIKIIFITASEHYYDKLKKQVLSPFKNQLEMKI